MSGLSGVTATFTPYSVEEHEAIRKLYVEQGKSLNEVTKEINEQFWNGQEIRTNAALERKLRRLKAKKRYNYSKYETGQISDIQKQIYELKKTKSYTQIAKILDKPLATVKSSLHTFREQIKRRKNLLVEAGMKTEEEQKEIVDVTKEVLFNKIERLEKELNHAKAINTIIVDTVKAIVPRLPKFAAPNIIVKKGSHKEEIAMLEFGDMHIGEKCIKEEMANISEYNSEICKQRMDTLFNSLAECIDIQRSKIPIKTLDINMLGDLVTGEDIYLGQARSTDMPLIEQTMMAANLIEQKLISPAIKIFNKVRLRCVFGNHGRIGKPGQYHVKSNFDYIIYQFLRERFKNNPRVEMYISESPFMLFQLPEAPKFMHLLSHGNEVNSWMSIPFYGIQRDHAKYMSMLGMNINYWHLAHFHNAAKVDIPHGEHIINGTFVGGSELSIFKMKTMSQPKQLLFGFNATRGITWRYDLQLEDVTKNNLIVDGNGIYTPTYTQPAEINGGIK